MVRSLLLALYFAGLLAGQTTPSFNWNSRIASDAPLTGNERWKLAFHNSFASPGPYFQAAGAALGQTLGNTPKEWGRTGEGFGRRVGLGFLTNSSQLFVHSGSSAMLGYDPRYQRCDCKGGWRRIGHAFSGIILSADSQGKRGLNPSNLVGAYTSGYIGPLCIQTATPCSQRARNLDINRWAVWPSRT